MKKNHARQLILKKIFILWPKKNSHKEFGNKKKFLEQNRTKQVRFYLLFNFHLQFTNKSVGSLCIGQ